MFGCHGDFYRIPIPNVITRHHCALDVCKYHEKTSSLSWCATGKRHLQPTRRHSSFPFLSLFFFLPLSLPSFLVRLFLGNIAAFQVNWWSRVRCNFSHFQRWSCSSIFWRLLWGWRALLLSSSTVGLSLLLLPLPHLFRLWHNLLYL